MHKVDWYTSGSAEILLPPEAMGGVNSHVTHATKTRQMQRIAFVGAPVARGGHENIQSHGRSDTQLPARRREPNIV